MLDVYFGTDTIRVRQKAFDFLHACTDEDTLVTQITPDQYQDGLIQDLARTTSLFGTSQVVVLDMLSDDTVIFEQVKQVLAVLKDSLNQFIMIEGALNAADKKKISSYAIRIDETTGEKKERFNAFLLTDAFLRRDKKSLWFLLREAWKEGLSNEELIGVLLWQLKVMRLVEKTKSAEEAGQKPFVYGKAKRALGSFKKRELDTMSYTLVSIYHEGHAGIHDIDLALERWVLTL